MAHRNYKSMKLHTKINCNEVKHTCPHQTTNHTSYTLTNANDTIPSPKIIYTYPNHIATHNQKYPLTYPQLLSPFSHVKGCGMGPWLVLVSLCFRENVVATCKIGSFLCSLVNLLQKNVIVLLFGNQIPKWRSFEKRAIFDLLFTFSSHQGKVTKIPSAHISLTYIHVFCSPY